MGEKLCAQSLTQLLNQLSLFDAPETEALALRQQNCEKNHHHNKVDRL